MTSDGFFVLWSRGDVNFMFEKELLFDSVTFSFSRKFGRILKDKNVSKFRQLFGVVLGQKVRQF